MKNKKKTNIEYEKELERLRKIALKNTEILKKIFDEQYNEFIANRTLKGLNK